MQLLKYHVSEVHRSEDKPGTDSDGVNPSCGPAGPKERRNKQQVRGVAGSDGWRRFHIKKDHKQVRHACPECDVKLTTKTNLRSSVSKTSHHSEQNLDSLRSVEKRAPYMCFSISDTL